MAQHKQAERVERSSTRTGLEGADVSPNEAGAFGDREHDVTSDRTGGSSQDKGVAEVGDPAVATGGGKGLRAGQPSKHGVMTGRNGNTLESQLADAEIEGSDEEPPGEDDGHRV
jgi:hypothetical protein